jgi:sec-independent protein translocase protein TatA
MLNSLALIGVQEGLIVLVAVLVLFGGKKIPELMRGVGQGVGELKKGMEEGQRTLSDAAHHEPTSTNPTNSSVK